MRKNSGTLVETLTGKKGIVYKKYGLVNGKVPVYIIDSRHQPTGEKVLCELDKLKIKGYVD